MDKSEKAILWGSAAAEGTPRLSPVLARAIDLGRGPPALMRWLRGQQENGQPPTDIARLANTLHRVVRQVGVAETIME